MLILWKYLRISYVRALDKESKASILTGDLNCDLLSSNPGTHTNTLHQYLDAYQLSQIESVIKNNISYP